MKSLQGANRLTKERWPVVALHEVRPNPSFKRRANGKPPGPGRWYSVHFHRPGPGVLPLAPA
jgi:hypothetical protein